MSPEELQANYIAAVLYYCNVTNGDSNRYYTEYLEQLSPNIGTLDVLDNNWIIGTWQITQYTAPSNTTLAIPDLVDILEFFQNIYANPFLIQTSQPFRKFTSTELTNMETTKLLRVDLVINSTTDTIGYFESGVWTPLY